MILPRRAIRIAADGDILWAACGRWRSPRGGWLYAVDTRTEALGEPIRLDGEPRAVAIGPDAVWVACAPRRRREGTIERIQRGSGFAEAWALTNWPVFDLAAVEDSLLATMSLRVSGTVDASGGIYDLGGAGGGDGGGGGGGHHG